MLKMSTEEFEELFDAGEDVTSVLDLPAARRPGLEQRRVNVDFPSWMIEELDREAKRLGVTRSRSSRFGLPNGSSIEVERGVPRLIVLSRDATCGRLAGAWSAVRWWLKKACFELQERTICWSRSDRAWIPARPGGRPSPGYAERRGSTSRRHPEGRRVLRP